MHLTAEQQSKVKDNIRLVYQVIKDKVHHGYSFGIYNYDDLVQIGSIGLCKAAATDKGGTFSTYAYRLIWNEICDALIYATRRQTTEIACDTLPSINTKSPDVEETLALHLDMEKALDMARNCAPLSTQKGIEAMILMVRGYSCREIGIEMEASDKLVSAWVSKARKFLKMRPEIMALAK